MNMSRFWFIAKRAGLILGAIVSLAGAFHHFNKPYKNHKNARINGEWTIYDTVETCSLKNYIGLKTVFRANLTYIGDGQFIGRGEKILENDQEPSFKSTIKIQGTIVGKEVRALFDENGLKRQSNGSFTWKFLNNDKLEGRFDAGAASSKGTSIVIRRAE